MLPLAGIKVVEIAQNLAGPYAGAILAHMGADVVKVERPEGDDARGWGPPFWRGTSPAFLAVNGNKRSIALDLTDARAVGWLMDYLAGADVLVQNLRPGAIEALGLGPEAVLARHPRLVYCSLLAFGRAGPLRLKPGYEPMVQAFAGLMMVSGEEGGPPTRIGTSILDLGTGMWAAIGALGGLLQRQRTGRGCVVDTSLFETALGWLGGHYATFRVSGEPPARHRTGSPRVVVFQGFETRTGPLIVAAANDRLFAKLARALGRPEWADDPRFATNARRVANKDALLPEVEAIMLTRTKGEWIDRLEAAGVPCAPVHDLREVLAHPQTAAVGMIQPVPGLDLDLMGLPVCFDGARPPIRRPPPGVGEHGAEIRGAARPEAPAGER
jgi:crotonobetainyl-CoA:carnitine CoA-transferase CaiB-like acyl-CoA transferase